jgi:general secretion pathway protein J
MRAPRGFTLVEIVVAVAITGFIGLAIGTTFSSIISSKETIEAQADQSRMLRAAMSRMVREIGAAFVSDRYDAKRYRDAYDRPTNFVGARDKLLISTLSHQRLYADAKESDQMIVEYQVKTSTDSKAKGRSDLFRREKAILEERMDRGGSEEVLYEGVKKIEFQYWNSERKQWDDEWDTRRTERKTTLPSRVKITLFTTDENGKDLKYTTQARIMLNTEFPRFQ